MVWGNGQGNRARDEDEGIGRTVGGKGSARPGWHLNPPHVVDLMEGCRSPIRRTGERTRTRAPASNLLHVSTPGSLATTISGTAPDHQFVMAGWNASPETVPPPQRRAARSPQSAPVAW